ncbi:MAG TPA: hypothetical protein PKV73_01255 [Agriterribacter sp.]|nr:hypothetical protein [Agriterribacter sp.]
MTQWKSVAHLYLGCDVDLNGVVYTLTAVQSISDLVIVRSKQDSRQGIWMWVSEIKPILRPLSDMTEEEILYVGMLWEKPFPYSELPNKIKSPHTLELAPSCIGSAEVTQYLLSRHFDLFNLIETNQAIKK